MGINDSSGFCLLPHDYRVLFQGLPEPTATDLDIGSWSTGHRISDGYDGGPFTMGLARVLGLRAVDGLYRDLAVVWGIPQGIGSGHVHFELGFLHSRTFSSLDTWWISNFPFQDGKKVRDHGTSVGNRVQVSGDGR